MTIEQFNDILFDGTEEEIKALTGSVDTRASYDYSEAQHGFTVRYDGEIVKQYGPIHKPNCVSVLGPSFVFK